MKKYLIIAFVLVIAASMTDWYVSRVAIAWIPIPGDPPFSIDIAIGWGGVLTRMWPLYVPAFAFGALVASMVFMFLTRKDRPIPVKKVIQVIGDAEAQKKVDKAEATFAEAYRVQAEVEKLYMRSKNMDKQMIAERKEAELIKETAAKFVERSMNAYEELERVSMEEKANAVKATARIRDLAAWKKRRQEEDQAPEESVKNKVSKRSSTK